VTYNSHNLVLQEECDYSETFVYLDPATNLPVDITNWRAELQVRVGPNGDFSSFNNINAQLVYNTDTSAIVLGGTAGTITLTIPYKDTYQLYWMTGDYSLILVTPVGKRIPFLKGFLTVLANASKLGNSTLVNDAEGTIASPNNKGLQAQDSNNPAVPSPSAGTTPDYTPQNAVERLECIVGNLDY
jgi:hypothetical protein